MYFLLLKSVVCALRGWYLKKKATTPPTQTHPKVVIGNLKGYNLIGQVIGLFSRDHQFELYKNLMVTGSRFTWSLTSGPVRLVEVYAS